MSLNSGSDDDDSSGGHSLNDQLTKFKLENEKLQIDNNSLRNDKSILEEIITEKDKLINNLQLQIDNLQKFTSSVRSPSSQEFSGDVPQRSAQRQYRSVSSPVKSLEEVLSQLEEEPSGIETKSEPEENVVLAEEGTNLENAPDLSKQSISFNNDETITEDTEPVIDIPQRNPNHHIPIRIEEDSPVKSVASSNYSPQKADDDVIADEFNFVLTPSGSPTRPTAQLAQYMGIPVSEMVWGSSPARRKSPLRGQIQPMSPLKNQLFAESVSTLLSPEIRNEDDDEFVFSPIGGRNGSSTNTAKVENPRSPDLSLSSIQRSIDSQELSTQRFPQTDGGNDLESVVKFMDKKLNVQDRRSRSRASTVSSTLNQQKYTGSSITSDRNALLNLGSLKLPSESNISKVSSVDFVEAVPERNPFHGYSDFNLSQERIPLKHPGTQNVISTISNNREISAPVTPATVHSGLFNNFDEDELKNLMVRPHDLETTLISVISVIDGSSVSGKKKAEDPSMTFGCFLVENSGEKREIFKFTKTYSQLLEFDHIVRAHFFELLPLPELSSFLKTTPQTVEFRRQILNNYFYKLYDLKIKPKDLALAICKFVSSDPVFNFDFNEHIVKEGLMLRKNSGKLNTAWKVSHCSIYGTTLELTDTATNKKQVLNIPDCKLVNEEDIKDVRYGISIVEPRKNVLSSSYSRIILCAESYEEKAQWLEALAKASNSSYLKSSSESMLSVPSGYDVSPDTSSLRYNNSFNNSKLSSPQPSEAPATPMSQSSVFDDTATLNSSTKASRKIGGLFGKRKDKPGKSISPEKIFDDSVSTVLEPVTNLESYQQQQQYVLPSATDSTFTFSPYSPSKDFSTGPELFGASLEEAINLSSKEYKGKTIPSICFRCIDYLEQKDAIYSEGIFRLTGKSSEINLLNELFNYKYDVDFNELDKLPDVDSISTLLKRYLRSLKESVITPDLVSALKLLPNNEGKVLFYRQKISTVLPKINFDLLYILLQYLIKVIKNKEINKMDINNITMLFSVNFNVDEDILSEFIINFDYIFDKAANPIPTEQRPYLRR